MWFRVLILRELFVGEKNRVPCQVQKLHKKVIKFNSLDS